MEALKEPKIPDIQRPSARMIRTQLVIAFVLGLSNLLMFCVLRYRYPKIFSARILRRKGLPRLPKLLFGWLKVVVTQLDEGHVLEHAGLDAFVFLSFFKMAIQILGACAFFGFFVISPIRYHYTGGYDQGDGTRTLEPSSPEEYEGYLWMYVVFTYTFTITVFWILYRKTNHVLHTRQRILGQQNSVTDRTIRLSGIPPELRDKEHLGRHIERLGVGHVEAVVLCREWWPLSKLFDERKVVLSKLESAWAQYLAPLGTETSFTYRANNGFALTDAIEQAVNSLDSEHHLVRSLVSDDVRPRPITETPFEDSASRVGGGDIDLGSEISLKRPHFRTGLWGWFGPKVDSIDYYSAALDKLDEQIQLARATQYPATATAFITMESVAAAQMVAQAVLDPHANYLTPQLAPAPHDVIWYNACLLRVQRLIKAYHITIVILAVSIALIFPVTYLAALLNTKTILKFFPALGEFLRQHHTVEGFVTGLLPTYIFTLLNVVIPFLFVRLSEHQGYVSHGEQELSAVLKNFFYLFVNLFLVFTLAGTASNYWSFLSDTTKIAKQLATLLRDLALFYVDLIIFQGIGMFPFKLLLFGTLCRLPFRSSKTARERKTRYKPPVFNFGLALPQPLLVLLITIIYSVMLTKILVSGLVYFIIGYHVYKYQLVYSMVHPPHSTGKVWPLIFRRVVLGLLIFQLTMAGLLALQNGFILAICLAPLPFVSVGLLYDFQKHYAPLSDFIALRSIRQEEYSDEPHNKKLVAPVDEDDALVDLEPSVLVVSDFLSTVNPNLIRQLRQKRERTLDEMREKGSTYEYSYLTQPLDGPWIAIDGSDVVMVNDGVTTRRRIEFFEWE